ncbi:MAG: DUF167 domain-containing protein [Bdellovibrionales bacterium]|jgi:hypothetical protein
MTLGAEAFTITERGLGLMVKARPAARRVRGARFVDIGEGQQALEVTVAAQAVEGKANKAILDAVAQGLGVKASAVTLGSGATGRLKRILVEGDAPTLVQRLMAWISEK